jgi:DNA-binding transcriptional ArsR family regulator
MPPSTKAAQRRAHATVLAALGDETRLLLLTKLTSGQRSSITELHRGSHLTRQAITKHLRVMQAARIVHCHRSGRESLFELDPKPILELSDYLNLVSHQWDQALLRLKSFIEQD